MASKVQAGITQGMDVPRPRETITITRRAQHVVELTAHAGT